jgi:TRAP-type C4-dicarboxylate transport system permease small subunit
MDALDVHRSEAESASSIPCSWLDKLVWFGGVISAALIVYILAITTVAVVCRYFLGNPIRGVDEQTGFLIVAVVMAGAAEVMRRDEHIGIDILTNLAPPSIRRLFEGLGHIAVAVFAGTLFYTAWHTVTFSYGFQAYSTGALEIPMWIPQSTMLAGAVLLFLVAVLKFVRLVLGTR